ncbi:CD151 antigen-like [Chrysoperla carnea]|uniref:CD151 antigen-like n=1 Tax=Chrysoperla carnea TaxID=189513 RepID=UPI001D07E9FF|nr:CD151 antigen-like [Chrysoperla carnea]XP_044739612.1 CD151 antigen-like [Chrysoperla carnea]
MGIGGCAAIIKVIVVLSNFIFWIIGIALTALAIWVLTDRTDLQTFDKNYTVGSYILLIAGILIVIVSFFGCCGAFKESRCLLIAFSSCLLVIIVLELSAGIWADYNKERLEPYLRKQAQKTIEDDYWTQELSRKAFNSIQANLECCGGEGPQDWARSKNGVLELSVTSNTEYEIPTSCCVHSIQVDQCEKDRHIRNGAINYASIYKAGCTVKIIKYLKDLTTWIMIVGFTLAALQFIGIIFACILINAIKSSDQYKA